MFFLGCRCRLSYSDTFLSWCRRAHVRKAMGKLDGAVSDLKRILDIEPRNTRALDDLRAWTGESSLRLGQVNSVFKLVNASEHTSDALRRIAISEVGGNTPVKSQGDICEKRQPSGDSSASGPLLGPVGSVISVSASAQPAAFPSISREPPTNWLQMERELRELIPSNRPSLPPPPPAVDYLCSLDPRNYASVIGSNLNSSCLSRLLSAIAMNSSLNPTQKAERLAALTKLCRFDMTWLMASDEDHRIAEQIIREVPLESVGYLKKYFD